MRPFWGEGPFASTCCLDREPLLYPLFALGLVSALVIAAPRAWSLEDSARSHCSTTSRTCEVDVDCSAAENRGADTDCLVEI